MLGLVATTVLQGRVFAPAIFFRRRIFEARFLASLSALRRAFQKLMNNKKGGHVIGGKGSMVIGHGEGR